MLKDNKSGMESIPEMTNCLHLLLSCGDDHLASMASMAGKVTPSPSPSITRTWAGQGTADRGGHPSC